MDDTFQNKRLFVHIRNTRSSEVPFVSYNGQSVQNQRAMITGQRQGNLLELNMGGQLVHLPSHFLIPDHPSKDNQTVVVLEGEKKGNAYKTMKVAASPNAFELSPLHRRKRKGELTMESSKLAVADYKAPRLQ
jgi:hypothetical protein